MNRACSSSSWSRASTILRTASVWADDPRPCSHGLSPRKVRIDTGDDPPAGVHFHPTATCCRNGTRATLEDMSVFAPPRRLLFGAGPTQVSERVYQAMSQP